MEKYFKPNAQNNRINNSVQERATTSNGQQGNNKIIEEMQTTWTKSDVLLSLKKVKQKRMQNEVRYWGK